MVAEPPRNRLRDPLCTAVVRVRDRQRLDHAARPGSGGNPTWCRLILDRHAHAFNACQREIIRARHARAFFRGCARGLVRERLCSGYMVSADLDSHGTPRVFRARIAVDMDCPSAPAW